MFHLVYSKPSSPVLPDRPNLRLVPQNYPVTGKLYAAHALEVAPMAKRPKNRPSGGKGNRSNYQTTTIRVPLPLKKEVLELIDRFHKDNEIYASLPLQGDWWEVLGVSSTALADEVREAYRRLARLCHPDQNLRLDATERFQAVARAYKESGFKQ